MTEKGVEKLILSDQQWKERLTPEQYKIARKHGTERAFTSPLNDVKSDGMYSCVCCGEQLFSSDAKFDSGTGWPSYFEPAHGNSVTEHSDRSFFMVRTEVRCAKCDSHLGHVFPDGPDPTGLRYCINGAVLEFTPDQNDQ